MIYTNNFNCAGSSALPAHRQRGIVLFFALIAMVVMMLAAVALIRSVDTSTSVAGNLAFKQSATVSADSGVETALALLRDSSLDTTVNSAANAAKGYFATAEERNLTGSLTTIAAFSWNDTNSAVAKGEGIVAGLDASGNRARFVIERMCTTAVANAVPSKANCLFGQGAAGGSSSGIKDGYPGLLQSAASISPVYRVTAQVTGPKNTISYVQAYIY